jgi:hypothetical protein
MDIAASTGSHDSFFKKSEAAAGVMRRPIATRIGPKARQMHELNGPSRM